MLKPEDKIVLKSTGISAVMTLPSRLTRSRTVIISCHASHDHSPSIQRVGETEVNTPQDF